MLFQIRITGLLIAMIISISNPLAIAGLTDDLQLLEAQSSTVQNSLTNFSFNNQTCSDLGLINSDIKELVASADTIIAGLGAPLALSDGDLNSLDNLSEKAHAMAADSVRLSLELQSIGDVADLFEYRAALSAMLELSDDIGTMADRILQMANRILVMADNILLMADRILITQQIQNANVALTQESILITQKNMIALSYSLSTISYNITLGQLNTDAKFLLDDMTQTNLTSDNMVQVLEGLQTTTSLMVTALEYLYTWMSETSKVASYYINGDTLTYLGDLSTIYVRLASALELYSGVIIQLAPLTDTPIISDATTAMLYLTADINLMAGRILEMSDKIVVMADNIGLMADNIIATQELQQTNIELTQNSLFTAKKVTITVISDISL